MRDLFSDLPQYQKLQLVVPAYQKERKLRQVNELEQLVARSAKEQAVSHPLLLGVDEAGRGPWAGPVVAAAVILPLGHMHLKGRQQDELLEVLAQLDDSKSLSEKKRLALIKPLCRLALGVGASFADAREIETLNIAQANFKAMRLAIQQALVSCKKKYPHIQATPLVLVDGSQSISHLSYAQAAVTKGDQRSYHIAAASIIAKVLRDKMMIAADRRYPEYGFAQHKGYGTQAHQEALKLHGICHIHRRNYKPIMTFL